MAADQAVDVTVVVPTRNRWRLLRHTLATILGQRDVRVEVIVVDEASTDDTPERLASMSDDRVRTIRNERPVGVAAARNAGTAMASSEWVAWCDDDDLWAPDKLAAQLAAVAEQPSAGWVAVGDVTVNERLEPVELFLPPPDEQLVEILGHNVVPAGGSGVLARRALVDEVGGFDTALSITADWEMWIRLWAGAPLVAVRRPLVGYRRHAGGMSGRNTGLTDELRHVLDRHAGLRRDAGVVSDRAELEEWRATMHLFGERRFRAAARALGAIAHGGRIRHLSAWAGLALVDPERIRRRLDDVGRRRVAPWAQEVDEWLAPLVAAHAAAGDVRLST